MADFQTQISQKWSTYQQAFFFLQKLNMQKIFIVTSSGTDKKLEIDRKLENKLEIYKNLEIKLEICKNLEIKLEIYKNLENKLEIYSYFKLENKLEIFEFFVNGRWTQY